MLFASVCDMLCPTMRRIEWRAPLRLKRPDLPAAPRDAKAGRTAWLAAADITSRRRRRPTNTQRGSIIASVIPRNVTTAAIRRTKKNQAPRVAHFSYIAAIVTRRLPTRHCLFTLPQRPRSSRNVCCWNRLRWQPRETLITCRSLLSKAYWSSIAFLHRSPRGANFVIKV